MRSLPKQFLSLGCVVLLAGLLSGCGYRERAMQAEMARAQAAANAAEAQKKVALDKALAELDAAKKKGGCGADGGCCCAAAGKACCCSGGPAATVERPAAFWSANAVVLTAAPQGHGPWLASSTYLLSTPPAK